MKVLVSDALWERVAPLLPEPPQRRFRFPGRKPLDRRKVLCGILFVLKTGIAWDDLPTELGWGCGKTCRHYLQFWHKAGVWDQLHAIFLAELNAADLIDWDRALIDGSMIKAPLGGDKTGPNPTDRGKSGSKHHVVTDGKGIPLAVTLTGANVPDVKEATNALSSIPPVGGKPGPKREKIGCLQADTGYDSQRLRAALEADGTKTVIPKRGRTHGSGLGVLRWYVERTISWLHQLGRLRRRLDRIPAIHEAWLKIGCAMICMNILSG